MQGVGRDGCTTCPHVLLCCILAVAAGADSYRAIARFIKIRFAWLQMHTGLAWRQAPGHTGWRAILLGLDQHAVEQALRRHASAALAAAKAGETTIAIDGKSLRQPGRVKTQPHSTPARRPLLNCAPGRSTSFATPATTTSKPLVRLSVGLLRLYSTWWAFHNVEQP